jgi:hypothetical protein
MQHCCAGTWGDSTLSRIQKSQVQDRGAGQMGRHADSVVEANLVSALLRLPNTLDWLHPCRAGLCLCCMRTTSAARDSYCRCVLTVRIHFTQQQH